MSSVFDPHLSGGPTSYIHWKPEHSRYAIELKPELIASLSAEASAACDSGIEAGGVLIGSFPPTVIPTVRIEGYLRVQRRNEDGPFYTFTLEQQERFTTVRRNANTRETSAVGFFRSHRRDTPLALSEEDRALLAAEFKRSIHVALIIDAREPRHAALYTSAEGAMPEQPSIPEFLFDAVALRSLAAVHPAFTPTRFDKSPPAESEPTLVRVSVPREAVNGARYGFIAVAAALAFIGGFIVRPLLPTPALEGVLPVSAEFLNLRAARDEQLIRVTWNHKAPEIERAKGATLAIAEGLKRREIHLDRDELRSGAVEYEPDGRQALVLLTLEMPEGTRVLQFVTSER